MNFNIEFAPLLQWPFIWVFAAAAALAVAFMFYKNIKGAMLRLLTAILLLAALANPIIRQDERQPLSDIAVAVVDESQSQSIGKRTEQTQKALTDLKSRIAQLGGTELRVINVKSGIASDADGTRLFTALNRTMADVPRDRFAGAFLITDGQVHDVPGNLTNLPTPIHSLISGSKSESDRRIVIDRSPRFGIVGQNQIVQFHVEDSNKNDSVAVTIQIPGQAPATINIEPGAVTDLSVAITHAGQNLVEISAALRADELSKQNNHAISVIEGIRDRLRVLLVSGQPHPGERTWRNLLKADASVDLVHFTILRPPEKQDGTPTKELSLIAFPTRELFIDKLDQFDLVIFDRYRRQAILPDSYLANVAEYVRKGGALLIASGPDFADAEGLYSTPLADVLAAAPTGAITETPYQPALTDAGNRHPVTRDLPGFNNGKPNWGRWFRLIDANVAPGSETLMSGPENKPLLVLNRVGEGRVAQFLSDHGWLWARGYEGGGPQTELLRRMAHWLMKEPDLEEEYLTGKQVENNIIIERRSMLDAPKPITVTSPSGKTRTVNLKRTSAGIFSAQLPAEETGLHTLSDDTLQAAAAIGNADAKEASDIRATVDKLQPIAKATGGGIAWLEDGMPTISKTSADQIMAGVGWMSIRNNGLYRVTAIKETSLFTTLLSLALLLIAASMMWLREGR
jgi:hypothetical protein